MALVESAKCEVIADKTKDTNADFGRQQQWEERFKEAELRFLWECHLWFCFKEVIVNFVAYCGRGVIKNDDHRETESPIDIPPDRLHSTF